MTEKKENKDIINERSDVAGLKSTISKNIPIDISQNSLLSSSEIGKKSSDKKSNDIKQSNLLMERSINKQNRKQIESDTFHTYDIFDDDFTEKKKTTKKEEKKKTVTKILVDDIENIYSTLIDKTNNKYFYHKNFILLIVFLLTYVVGSFYL